MIAIISVAVIVSSTVIALIEIREVIVICKRDSQTTATAVFLASAKTGILAGIISFRIHHLLKTETVAFKMASFTAKETICDIFFEADDPHLLNLILILIYYL
jgi:hypothetical protein